MNQRQSSVDSTESATKYISEIGAMNFEINIFLNSFKTFQNKCNVIDKELLENLMIIVEQVDSFLEGNPAVVTTNSDSENRIADFQKNGLRRVFVCNNCVEKLSFVGDSFHDVCNHHLQHPLLNKAISTETVNSNVTSKSFSRRTYKYTKPKKEKQRPPPKKVYKKEIKEKQPDEVNLPKKARDLFTKDLNEYMKSKLAETMEVNEELFKPLKESLMMKINDKFRNVEILLFGSRVTGLGTINSDVDIFIDFDNSFFNYHQTWSSVIEKLWFMEELLKADSNWTDVQAIKDARIPILRGFFAPLKMKCDISFSHGLGVLNTRLIKYLFEACPLFHKMCLFLKAWKEKCLLKMLTSTYALILMVLFYLQKSGILPPIEKLQETLDPIIKIGPWWGDFNEISSVDQYPSDGDAFLMHLHKFFEFYKNFAYDTYIICPIRGKEVSIQNVMQNFGMPERYFEYVELDNTYGPLQLDKPMIIQDPLELNHNVVKGLSASDVAHLRKFFALSLAEIERKLYN